MRRPLAPVPQMSVWEAAHDSIRHGSSSARVRPVSAGKSSAAVAGSISGQRADTLSPLSFPVIHALVEVLKAVASTCIKPLIRRVVFLGDPSLIHGFAQVLQPLAAARRNIESFGESATARLSSLDQGMETFRADATFALGEIEKFVAMVLECLALIDVEGFIIGEGDYRDEGHGVSSEKGRETDAEYSSSENKAGKSLYVKTFCALLASISSTLTLHADGGMRVITISVLRKLVPQTLRALTMTVNDSEILQSLISQVTRDLLDSMPSTLVDAAPVPLYGVRLLGDLALLLTPPNGSHTMRPWSAPGGSARTVVVEALGNAMLASSMAQTLVSLLKSQFGIPSFRATTETSDSNKDVHLLYLIRTLCGVSGRFTLRLLESGIASVLAAAVSLQVKEANALGEVWDTHVKNRQFSRLEGYDDEKTDDGDDSGRHYGLLDTRVLIYLIPLTELTHYFLHYSFKVVSAATNSDSNSIGTEKKHNAAVLYSQQCRNLTSELRFLGPLS